MVGVFFQHTWRQNFRPLGRNWLGAMHASKTLVLPCFVYTRVFAIFVLIITVLIVWLVGGRTFIYVFWHTQSRRLLPCIVAHIFWWHPQLGLSILVSNTCTLPTMCWDRTFLYWFSWTQLLPLVRHYWITVSPSLRLPWVCHIAWVVDAAPSHI